MCPSWGQPSAGPPAAQKTAAHDNLQGEPDEPAAQPAALEQPRCSVITQRHAMPDVELVDEAGAPGAMSTLLESNQSVALSFIFTTCTTICPVMTATFARMRRVGFGWSRSRSTPGTTDPTS